MSADRVLLLRHGRTAFNQAGRWQGQLDVELDETGLRQADQVAEVLAARLHGLGEVVVVSSDLRRAAVTARTVARRLGVPERLDPRLREIYAGTWQGLTRAEIQAAGMSQELDAWMGGADVPIGGGERRSEVARRGAQAVAEHAADMDGGVLVAVTHGGLIRGAVLALVGLDPTTGNQILGGQGNCHWVELTPGQPHWVLRAYNLPPSLATLETYPPVRPGSGRDNTGRGDLRADRVDDQVAQGAL